MSKTRDIIEALGRKRLASELGIGENAVRNVETDDVFPASWFIVLKRMCIERGDIDCPASMFRMKPRA